jgi:hypothetical protein
MVLWWTCSITACSSRTTIITTENNNDKNRKNTNTNTNNNILN